MFKNITSSYISFLVVFSLLLAGIFMVHSAQTESATMDELAHIPSGYSYVKYLDYRLNPEHPPLLKALSAVPLLFTELIFPTDNSAWTTEINGQWDMGTSFLYQSGNDANLIVLLARIFPIILTLLLGLLVFIWAKEIIGPRFAFIPFFLFIFSPNVLAHGHYVTTDIAATFGVVFATYMFIKALLTGTRSFYVWSGIAFGIAQLLKFSNVLLIPFFIVISLIYAIAVFLEKRKIGASGIHAFISDIWRRSIVPLLWTACIGFVVIYAVYFVFTLHYPVEKQLSDTKFILGSYSSEMVRNIEISLVQNPVTRPFAHYALGLLMVGQRASGGNTGYFMGEVSSTGWWYYFPLVFIMKETIPALIIIFSTLIFGIYFFFKKIYEYHSHIFSSFFSFAYKNLHVSAMILFIGIYWFMSMRSPLNIGMRHIIPTLPFFYILSAIWLKRWVKKPEQNMIASFFRPVAKIMIISLLLVWSFTETVSTAPHFLSYFNEPSGGLYEGYRRATDSNYDWGQDLKLLSSWAKENNIQKIAIDYFGGGNPKYYLGDSIVEYWWSEKGNPKDQNIEWFAVSINSLENALGTPVPGFERKEKDSYTWLTDERAITKKGIGQVPTPDYRIGTSIFIYHL